ncbi:unnamed protein product [Nesidiocoris tenuis]|uniref:GOST seven transmembrane domain-containing protein n=1 Tax=Nesidiocoris tenuis TaxID=355587 RepID=A0A6H5GD66_9HEMI|nr:unnamed protein product [Nesidiocoris tenuis]
MFRDTTGRNGPICSPFLAEEIRLIANLQGCSGSDEVLKFINLRLRSFTDQWCWRMLVSEGDNGTIQESSTLKCSPHMLIPEHRTPAANAATPDDNATPKLPDASANEGLPRPVLTIDSDGFYKVTVSIKETLRNPFKVTLSIELRSSNGSYLSAADWPLLPFYGVMCLVYVCLGIGWLVVSFLQWRDLLRIQFWIGGVIFLGMLEMATFYAEYSSYNATGSSEPSVVLLAELVSCCKRTLARMLVIIVSLGFGIVKPRLGPMLHRVVGVGVLYFLLAITESYLRVYRPKNEPTNQFVLATVPLAVLDSAICWWIFISLSQTTRTLRLRRNLVKLSLYRHFTNILIFSVVASVVFMLYSIKAHHLSDCFEDWRELWMDEAYWRLLFTIILIVIMVLWRPTNNNQKYAFSPLLDAPDDDDDDDEEDRFVNDAYGVKMRGNQGSLGANGGASSASPKGTSATPDDDLKWVEENIPASLVDGALPILDSDEEIMATRFELSKMQ